MACRTKDSLSREFILYNSIHIIYYSFYKYLHRKYNYHTCRWGYSSCPTAYFPHAGKVFLKYVIKLSRTMCKIIHFMYPRVWIESWFCVKSTICGNQRWSVKQNKYNILIHQWTFNLFCILETCDMEINQCW